MSAGGFESDAGTEFPEMSSFATALTGDDGKCESCATVSSPASDGASDDNGEDGGADRYLVSCVVIY